MQQGSEGVLYSNQHPVNREVCLSSNLIVPIDNAVVYLSEQGVMALQGAESNLLSPVFGGVPDALPQDSSDGDSISLSEDFVPFRKYMIINFAALAVSSGISAKSGRKLFS